MDYVTPKLVQWHSQEACAAYKELLLTVYAVDSSTVKEICHEIVIKEDAAIFQLLMNTILMKISHEAILYSQISSDK